MPYLTKMLFDQISTSSAWVNYCRPPYYFGLPLFSFRAKLPKAVENNEAGVIFFIPAAALVLVSKAHISKRISCNQRGTFHIHKYHWFQYWILIFDIEVLLTTQNPYCN